MPRSIFLIFFTLVSLCDAHAQMFSVSDGDRDSAKTRLGLYAGIEPARLIYKGIESPALLAGLYELDGQVIRVKLEISGIYGYMGFGGEGTGIENKTWFDAGIRGGWKLGVVNREHLKLVLPLQLKTSILSINDDVEFDNGVAYTRGTLSAGIGAELQFKISSTILLSSGIYPQYGFCFSIGGLSEISGGQLLEFETNTRLRFDRVIGTVGLSAGWDWQFKRLDVGGRFYDYDLRNNSFLLGLIFMI